MITHKLGKQYNRLTARERGLVIVAAPINDQVRTLGGVGDEFRLNCKSQVGTPAHLIAGL
jgi:hypothetical protein